MFNLKSNLNRKRLALLAAAPVFVALSYATGSAEPPSAPPLIPSPFGNCSVTGMLADYAGWVKQSPSGGANVVRVSIASNQTSRLVSYAEGILTMTGEDFPAGPSNPNGGKGVTLSGTLAQFFSDRTYAFPAGSGSLSLNPHPFSPQHTDQLYLSIYTTSGQINFKLLTWGNTNLSLTGVECSAGLLYGFTNTNPSTMFVISLSKEFKPNPPNPK